jgi:hypothetical protein
MAKRFFAEENKVYPRGILVLNKNTIMPDGSIGDKICAPYWDVVLKNPNLLKEKDKIKPKDWEWHAVKDNKCVFHISGDNVIELVVEPDVGEIYGGYSV